MACGPVILVGGCTPMDHRLKSYLRPLRRRWGFTQQEIAFLIGVKSRTVISRIEASARRPSVDAAFICMLVFDVSPSDLFPGLIAELHEDMQLRANDLYEDLQGDSSKGTRIKLDFLERLLARPKTKRTDAGV